MVAGLGGCADYLKRQDTVTFSAGEAQAWNRAVHVTDPWPPYAANTRIDGDGQRVSRAMERYRTGDGTSIAIQPMAPAGPPANGAQPAANGAQPTASQPR